MRVLPLFLTACFAFPFQFPFVFDAGFAVALRAFAGIARSVLHISPRLLRFAFHLLRRTFHLGVRVTCPFAHLALYTSCCVVDCTFYSVLIHEFTSKNLWLASVLGCAVRIVGRAAECFASKCPRAMFDVGVFDVRVRRPLKLDRSSARDQLDEQHHECDNEKNVNKSPQGVRRNHAK
jgi:apolipoprotein N-acyltransferase